MKRRPKITSQFSFLLLFVLACACSEFRLTDQFTLRRIERQDHEFCISMRLDFENPNDLKNKVYWSCRLQLAHYHMIPEATTEDEIRNNRIIKYLIRKLSVKFEDAREANLERTNAELEEIDHKNCRSQGYTLNTLDQKKSEEYFICRRKLIDTRYQTLTQKEIKNLELSSNRYNLGYAINKRLEKKTEFSEIVKRDYPQCLEIEILDPLFTKCKVGQDRARACLAKIPQQKINEEVRQKVFCNTVVMQIMPDSYSKEMPIPENKLIPKKKDINYDVETLLALAITQNKSKEEEEKEQKKTFDNSKTSLYSVFELNLLRQKYVDSCYVEVDKRMIKLVADLEEKCTEIGENWNIAY